MKVWAQCKIVRPHVVREADAVRDHWLRTRTTLTARGAREWEAWRLWRRYAGVPCGSRVGGAGRSSVPLFINFSVSVFTKMYVSIARPPLPHARYVALFVCYAPCPVACAS